MRIHRSYFQYVLGGLLFSLAGVLFKPLVGIFGPLEIAAWRSVVVAIAVLAIRWIGGRSPLSLPISFSKFQWFSAVCFMCQTVFFSVAILLISTADTFLISNAAPVYMVFWQAIFDHRLPSPMELLIVGIAGIGLCLFFVGSLTAMTSPNHFAGLLAALVAGLAFAGLIFGQGRVGLEGTKNGEQYTLGSVLLGSALTCCVAFPLSILYSPVRTIAAPAWAIWCIVGLGIFQFAIPMMLWAKSLPRIPPLFAAFMPTLIAVWAPFWTYLLLDEPFPGAVTIIGAVIVHFAVLAAALRRLNSQTFAVPDNGI